MPIHFPSFERSVYERLILSRGMNMHEEGYIDHAEETGTNEWTFEINSERIDYVSYEVGIGIHNGIVTYYDCNCPYSQGPVCKHIVAALFYIRENDLYDGAHDTDGEEEDDDDEEEEEEEDEVPVPRRSRESKAKTKSKSKNNSHNNSSNSMEIFDPTFLDTDDVEKEFYCQVCLGIMDRPVSMPCNAHSVCYDCTLLLYKHQRNENGGYRLVSCPTCREGSGVLKIKKLTDIKVNLELKRIKEAYGKKKRSWMKEKETLQEMLGLNQPEAVQGNKGVNRNNNAPVGNMDIEEEIERMDLGKLGEIAIQVMARLHANGLTGGPVLEKYKEYFEGKVLPADITGSRDKTIQQLKAPVVRKVKEEAKEEVKVKDKSGFKREREVKSDEEMVLGRRYSLRNLKKVKK